MWCAPNIWGDCACGRVWFATPIEQNVPASTPIADQTSSDNLWLDSLAAAGCFILSLISSTDTVFQCNKTLAQPCAILHHDDFYDGTKRRQNDNDNIIYSADIIRIALTDCRVSTGLSLSQNVSVLISPAPFLIWRYRHQDGVWRTLRYSTQHTGKNAKIWEYRFRENIINLSQ